MSNRTLPETAQTLVSGRKLIEHEHDWCTELRRNGLGQMCALGAIGAVHGEVWDAEKVCLNAVRALGKAAIEMGFGHEDNCHHTMAIADLNNLNVDGHAGVMNMFDKAIADTLVRAKVE